VWCSQLETKVGIIGAGPAGLLLSHLLHLNGIDSILLEKKSREEVEETVRAGVLEQGAIKLLNETGLGSRMMKYGHLHHGIEIQYNAQRFLLNFEELIGKKIMVYPQHEVLKDLIAARMEANGKIIFQANVTSLKDIDSPKPKIEFEVDGEKQELICDFIAGCDGYHGPSRRALPKELLREIEHVYPFGWLGILAEAPISNEVLIYAYHERGFALISTRSPEIQRYYIQVNPNDQLSQWPDERIWSELHARVDLNGWTVQEGPIIQKDIVKMRSFVCETMQYGRLFLAGDAAHIVPPTGAKGMNLAMGDAQVLAIGLQHYYTTGNEQILNKYEKIRLESIWRAQRFSRLMTDLLHHNNKKTSFEQKIQFAELNYVTTSVTGATTIAENYTDISVNLPAELQKNLTAIKS